MQKVYLDENNHVSVSCPRCNKVKQIDATPFLKKEGTAKLTFRFKCSFCDCGHKSCAECKEADCNNSNTNVITIDRRKFFRKSVNLPGFLIDQDGKRHAIRVLDLSRTGLKAKLLGSHTPQPNQKFLTEFNLDDAKETSIVKRFIIRKTKDKVAEGQFTEVDEYGKYDRAIGFYLMN